MAPHPDRTCLLVSLCIVAVFDHHFLSPPRLLEAVLSVMTICVVRPKIQMSGDLKGTLDMFPSACHLKHAGLICRIPSRVAAVARHSVQT